MSLRPANHVLKLTGTNDGQLRGSSISLLTFQKGCVSKLEAVFSFCMKGLETVEVNGKKSDFGSFIFYNKELVMRSVPQYS